MITEREGFHRADEVFDAALDLPPVERSAFVHRACGNDSALRAAVERLLLAHDRSEGFLVESAAPLAAALLGTPVDATAYHPAGERVGPYRIVRELGHGGMGTVYLAERDDDPQFRRRVALKLVRGALAGGWMVERFLAERRILASLEHPHVARLYDFGSAPDGTPWFAMEYVEGEPIDRYCRERDTSLTQRLQLFRDVCVAVGYAHQRGVVHRDLKPSNILVSETGEAKLLDFGIAKLIDAVADVDSPRTRTGMQLMTPDYASPEQVRGEPVTAASDVYSLGIVLYELVVGQRPYRTEGLTPGEVERLVCETEPPRPSVALPRGKWRLRLGDDLDTIILKALQKEPVRRYASAVELLEDLERHAESRPVLARPDTLAYRARKFLGRHRLETAIAALLIAVVPLSAVTLAELRGEDARSDPSLIATGALQARDRILVADFADRAGDSALAVAVTEAVRIDLAQSPVVRVLTPRQVRVTLERMERSPDLALDDTLAREVAAREGVKAIVTGSVGKTGAAYSVSVQLIGAVEGEALAAFRETAADSSQLIPAIDRVSKRLRERVGESLRDLRAMPTLAEVATGSVEALRLYTEAQRRFRAGDRTGAIPLYKRVVALDTGFGSAHMALAMAYSSLGEAGRAKEAMRHALANQHRIPFVERHFVVGSNAHGAGDYETAATAYQRILDRYPDNARAMNNLALVFRDQRRYAASESLFTLATRIDSTISNLYFGIHGAQLLQGRFADSRRTLDLIAQRFPGNPVIGTVEIQDASARRDWEAAERHARAKIEAVRGDTLSSIDPYEALAGMAMAQGRLAEADRLWRTHVALSVAAGSHGRLLFGAVQRGYLALRYHSDTTRAIAIVDSVLGRFPLDSILPADRPYDELARFFANAGRLARSRELLAGADSNDRALERIQVADRSWTRGVVALAEGRPAQAVEELRMAARRHPCAMCALPALARAHEAAGLPRDAIDAYDRYLRTPWFFRYEIDAVDLGPSLMRLASLRAAQGDHSAAADARTQLERLWRRADLPLRRRMAVAS